MTDTPNIGLKKYGVTDPANLITGYNASMDTLDTVIKQAQDYIDAIQDSVFMPRGSNPAGLNIDSMTIPAGAYWVNASATGGTWPDTEWGLLLVFKHDAQSSSSTQIMNGNGRLWYRQSVNNNWSSWRKLSYES